MFVSSVPSKTDFFYRFDRISIKSFIFSFYSWMTFISFGEGGYVLTAFACV